MVEWGLKSMKDCVFFLQGYGAYKPAELARLNPGSNA